MKGWIYFYHIVQSIAQRRIHSNVFLTLQEKKPLVNAIGYPSEPFNLRGEILTPAVGWTTHHRSLN